MKLKSEIAIVALGAPLLGAGAFATPASAATTTTLPLVATSTANVNTAHGFNFTEGLRNRTGRKVGADLVDCPYNQAHTAANCAFRIGLDRGILEGTIRFTRASGHVVPGRILGGTGAYQGAQGTQGTQVANLKRHNTVLDVTYTLPRTAPAPVAAQAASSATTVVYLRAGTNTADVTTPHGFVFTTKRRDRTGRPVGNLAVDCTINQAGTAANCGVGFGLDGGLLTGSFIQHRHQGTVIRGVISGGSGAHARVKGVVLGPLSAGTSRAW